VNRQKCFINAIHFTIKKVKPAFYTMTPSLNIDWKIPAGKEIISEKDKGLSLFTECRNNFIYINENEIQNTGNRG
jgi:hypothetical protein